LNHFVSLTYIATGAIDVNQSRDTNADALIGVPAMVPGALLEAQRTAFSIRPAAGNPRTAQRPGAGLLHAFEVSKRGSAKWRSGASPAAALPCFSRAGKAANISVAPPRGDNDV
jgi:hypothetical protein